jgi:hypothetical protein
MNPSPLTVPHPARLSYTQFSLFERSPEEYYLTYIGKVGRGMQTQPMSVGSAFDAFVKSSLYKDVFQSSDPKFDLRTLFEAQVEPHNRDWARVAGAYDFEADKASGAYTSLLIDLQRSSCAPIFELKVDADISFGGVTIPATGHPDLRYKTPAGHWVIRDWKVNGYCSKSGVSPSPYYVSCDGKPHPKVSLYNCGGLMLSRELFDSSWVEQLCLYAWLVGVPVGRDFIAGIEQASCKPVVDFPAIRFARFQAIIPSEVQMAFWDRLVRCWTAICDGSFLDSSRRDQLNTIHADENISWMLRNNKMY